MKIPVKTLWICVAVETVGAAWFLVAWCREPIPPRPDLSHFHPATVDEIRSLEKQAFDDGTTHNWLALGKMYLLFGLFPEAEYSCRQAARSDPNSFEAHYWWGVALNQLGETSQAIDEFRQALPLAENQRGDPDAAARCWYAIGRNYLRQEQVVEAEQSLRKAAHHRPARHQLIRILVRSRRAAEALPMLDELIARTPRESTFYQLRARAREQLGNRDGAFEDRTAVERAPDKLRSDDIIAQLQTEAGGVGLSRELGACGRLLARNPQEAVTRLRKLLVAGWRTEIAELLIEAESRIGNAQQVADLLTDIMARDGTTVERLEQLAAASSWLGKHEPAFQIRKRIAELRHSESVHRELSRSYRQRGQTPLANRHHALARMTAGIGAFRENRIADAGLQLQEAVRLDPNLANAWYYLAECRRLRGQSAQSVEDYRNCLKVEPNHGRARSRLARLKESSGPTD